MHRSYRTVCLLLFLAYNTSLQAEIPAKPWGKPSLEGNWDFKTATPA